MKDTALTHLIPALQLAIGPVILISGVGLLLLSMTNRFGRITDRTRELVEVVRQVSTPATPVDQQVRILMRRARLVRTAILLTTLSVFFAALLIIVLFLAVLLGIESAWPVGLLFSGCMLALVAGLVPFLMDVNLSLAALHLELGSTAGSRH